MTPRWRVPLWARLLLAPVLLLGVLWAVDVETVLAQLRAADPAWLLASLSCAVASNLAAAWRWDRLLRWLGHRVGLARAAALCFQAVALNALLPGAVVGGDVWRVAALGRRGTPLREAGLSVVLDRLSGLWMVGVAGLFALAWGLAQGLGSGLTGQAMHALGLPATGTAAAFASALALAFVLLLGPAVALWQARRRAGQRPGAGFATASHTTPSPVSATALGQLAALVLHPQVRSAYVQQTLASTAVHLLSVAGLACAARALGLDLPYWVYIVAAVPIFLMATLPISFGGWGTREAAAGLALAAFGVPPAMGVAVAFTVGVLGLVQALAGAVLLAGDRKS